MITQLGTATLRSSERMEMVRVTGPEPEWTDRLVGALLSHKPPDTRENLRAALEEGVAPATLSFYVGLLDGRLVGNTTTIVGAGGQVGILAHVYTVPEHRRKGICRALLAATMEGFRSDGGRAMSLHTAYEGTAYWIYREFGFRAVLDTAVMLWRREPGFEAHWFGPGPADVRATHLGDWAPLDLLFAVPEGWIYRSVYYAQIGIGGFEGAYWGWQKAIASGGILDHRILAKPGGEVVGQAYLWADHRFGGSADPRDPRPPLVLDLFVHPSFHGSLDLLIGSLDLDRGVKVQAYAEAGAEEKVAALQRAGFDVEARLARQLRYRKTTHDVLLLARE